MYGYRISFRGIPKNVFACATVVDDYSWSNGNTEHMLEFSASRNDGTTLVIGDKKYCLEKGCHLSCVPGNENRKAYCEKGVKNEILSIAVSFEKLNIESGELSRADAQDNSVYLIPAFLHEIAEISGLEKMLNRYINLSVSEQPSKKAQCISVWFELLSAIDEITRRHLLAHKTSSENYYVKKLDYIIENRYSENLSLSEIAKEFGISMSYLSTVYKASSGQTFRNALYCMRMKKAKELIRETKMSCDEIAKQVGLCDETYLRKRFKAFFGVSISRFRNIDNELTLYHDKPVRKNLK